jgi:hypothetical protein
MSNCEDNNPRCRRVGLRDTDTVRCAQSNLAENVDADITLKLCRRWYLRIVRFNGGANINPFEKQIHHNAETKSCENNNALLLLHDAIHRSRSCVAGLLVGMGRLAFRWAMLNWAAKYSPPCAHPN